MTLNQIRSNFLHSVKQTATFIKKHLLTICLSVALSLLLCSLLVGAANLYVINTAEKYIISSEKATDIDDVDCILVLGCFVKSDGNPSDMLADRLEVGVNLYSTGASPKLLMSGDHGTLEYNEVRAMKNYALDRNVPSADIFMDHAGFSTYESMYRAKEVFGADKIIIVSQSYHLYRAVYIARSLGIEAYGVASDQHTYRGQIIRDTRELAARTKDLIYSVFRPLPTYLGDPIPLSGDGSVTEG